MSSNDSSKALKAGLWYTVSNIALRAVSVLTAPIFTRLLTPSDYGKFNSFFSWQTILACVFGLCLNYSIGRAKIDYKDDFNEFISSVQTLSILVGLSMLILALPFLGPLSAFMEIDKSLLISLMVLLVISPSLDYMQSKFRFEYRYKENVAIALINTVGVIVISIGLILLSELENRYAARIMGSVIPTFCLGTFAVLYLFKKGRKTVNLEYWKYALKFSIPMIPHGVAMVLLAQIDRIMLIKMTSDEAAGLYSFGYSYAIIISIFTNAIMNAWQPWLYDKVNGSKYEEVRKSNRQINNLAFFLTLCFILVGPEVIMALGSEPFYEAKWMVAPIIAGCFFQFFYGYFSLMEMYCKRTDIIAYGSVAAAVVKIGLNFIFIPSFGYIGAAYTTMLGYGLLLVYHWVIFRHIFKAKIFAERQMLLLVVLTVILTLLLAHTYDMYLIRYLILTALLLFTGYIYRTNIKSLIRNFLKHE
ncbi:MULTISPECIES: lipopolysaccharide biosynthesis protein [Bacteroides]|uniref:Uncharacterized protein n=1 Tax=Bacteroides intestinalis TaxID=329854 RepID=A0A4Q5HDL8_9BACE|nr:MULTISPECIES: oligosaccharide flippase family protein [Bacteroides]KAA4690589.1 oligosaccharide flippase family protein [Bacteroides intestinalis]KAA4717289.1 oligosaccharide flippase family protein [Bacteroides intestinalis]QDO69385.1 oligosaccharide flippase family protein [Bacteroides intestinalis]RYT79730.1 hypothetical protein EAJ06_12410 [Bacteroides intestinalis]UCB33564.1 oligosaccharide flippase family protein [Bacteroides intestinalis]